MTFLEVPLEKLPGSTPLPKSVTQQHAIAKELDEAKAVLAKYEQRYGMSSEQFENCDAEEVAHICSFDQIEWDFRIEQVKKLSGMVHM